MQGGVTEARALHIDYTVPSIVSRPLAFPSGLSRWSGVAGLSSGRVILCRASSRPLVKIGSNTHGVRIVMWNFCAAALTFRSVADKFEVFRSMSMEQSLSSPRLVPCRFSLTVLNPHMARYCAA